MKWRWSIFLFLLLLCGCNSVFSDNGNAIEQEKSNQPEKLVIYMSAPAHTFSKGETEETLYPSKHVIGTILVGGETEAPNGNIFEKALQEYEEMTGIELEIHYIEEYYNGQPTDPLQDQYEQSVMPDVFIFSKHPIYDFFRLAEQEILLDFTPYVTADEELQNSDQYYQPVLDGGLIQKKQYALPILFNLNGMITTESYLNSIGTPVGEENLSFEEVLNILNASCIAQADSKTTLAVWEGSGGHMGEMYFPSILTGAAYPRYFDEDMKSVILEEEVIADIFEVIKNFIWQDAVNAPKRDNMTYEEYLDSWNYSKSLFADYSPELSERIGIALTGGRAGGVSFHNSLLTDAAFFQSAYEKQGETMVLKGIPTYNDPSYYSANASLVAYGMASTEYPEAVYDLVRYLMDYGFPPAYGFSVNKELTQKQLELMTATSYTVSPESVWTGVEFGIDIEELEQNLMYTEPLDEETVEVIRNMLDHIAGAGLPCAVLEVSPYNSMVRMIGSNQMTPDEVGDWVVKTMEEYLTMQDTLKPFYDEAYNASVILEEVN